MNIIYLTHLYPDKMSIYGDYGNILAIKEALKLQNLNVVYQAVNEGDNIPLNTDFFFIGGGQDSDQYDIYLDLLEKKDTLIGLIEAGTPLLSICGGYQLLGNSFVSGTGQSITGIGVFPVETKSLDASVTSRCIGNIVVECNLPFAYGADRMLVGFENHGGQTFLNTSSSKNATYLGKTITGFGNNFTEKNEGCVYKNAIGTYLHGSCLPKNPNLTEYLVEKIIENHNFRNSNKSEVTRYTYTPPNQRTTTRIETLAAIAHKSLIKKFID